VNHSTNITGLKALVVQRSRQDDAVVFADHRFNLLKRVRSYPALEHQRQCR
jgi:hypothetical protein